MLSGALAQEDVTGVSGKLGVLGDEAEVLVARRVIPAEGHVLQAVEVVLTGSVGELRRGESHVEKVVIC